MQGILNIFSDPRYLVSILAIIISLISLVWSIRNQIKQNRQWIILNQANIQLTKTKLFLFKECSLEEINRRNYWGYKLTAYPDETFTKFQLPSYLTAKYTSSNKPVEKFNMVFTIDEADKQIHELGITEPWTLYKQFKVGFQFENIGKTDTKNLHTEILIEDPVSKEWKTVFSSNKDILAAGQPIIAQIGYSLPIVMEEPEKINYRIEIRYKDIYGKDHDKKIQMMWNRGNTWSHLSEKF